MTTTETSLRDQMLEWGAQRDEARESLRAAEKRIARLEAENGRYKAALDLIYTQSRRIVAGVGD